MDFPHIFTAVKICGSRKEIPLAYVGGFIFSGDLALTLWPPADSIRSILAP
jgi:hypothetical protein